jgi:hypothetical protein
MADGTYKNIEDVLKGDIVKSYNVYTQTFELSEVTDTLKHRNNKKLVLLTFSDNTTLKTTTTHPFYTTSG